MKLKSYYMNWQIKVSKKAVKELAKVNAPERTKIWNFIKYTLPKMDNPRNQGKALTGNLKGLWRYRIGNYRLMCEIKNDKLIILIISLGHRKQIYQKH